MKALAGFLCAFLLSGAARADSKVGFMLDAGLPDGANGSIVFRPFSKLRLHAGAGFNLVSPGFRAGASFIPFTSWITPTLTVDMGRYFEGDANQVAQLATGDPTFSAAVLKRVGYDYANAHIGLEMGQKHLTFYVHAGVSRILATMHDVESQLGSSGTMMSTVTISNDVPVRVWSVSARVGFIVYLGFL